MVCEQATNEERARAVSLLRLPIVLYGPSIRLCCKNDEEIKRSKETFLVSFRRPLQTAWQPRQLGLSHLLFHSLYLPFPYHVHRLEAL